MKKRYQKSLNLNLWNVKIEIIFLMVFNQFELNTIMNMELKLVVIKSNNILYFFISRNSEVIVTILYSNGIFSNYQNKCDFITFNETKELYSFWIKKKDTFKYSTQLGQECWTSEIYKLNTNPISNTNPNTNPISNTNPNTNPNIVQKNPISNTKNTKTKKIVKRLRLSTTIIKRLEEQTILWTLYQINQVDKYNELLIFFPRLGDTGFGINKIQYIIRWTIYNSGIPFNEKTIQDCINAYY